MVSVETLLTRAGIAPDPPAVALEGHLGYWLRLVSNEVSGAFARALQERQISVAEWVALNQLATKAGLTPARLAAAMGVTRGAVSKVLDKLESKKLIVRTASPLDSRVQLLSLTAPARRILPKLTEIANRNDNRFFAVLDSDQQASLRQILRQLAEVHGIARIPVA
ncbi:MAG: MarR family winged helix-turn-helix transcriptional regulator [Steroidobacteraceae bacterium]